MPNDAITLSQKYVTRFFGKIDKTDTCWIWQGSVKPNGYGYYSLWPKKVYAHRLSYELHYGPIPDGLHIDHLCRMKLCVNPDHLEAVTQQVNNERQQAAKTHCAQGHPWTDEHISVRPNGTRYCKTCNREQQRLRKARKRP